MAVLSDRAPTFEEAGTSETRLHRTFFGVRVSAFLEIGVFLVVGVVIDTLFFSGDRFRSLEPHPFWAIILLTAVQYGSKTGLLASVASILVLLVGNLPEQSFDQDFYAYLRGIAFLPILWILTPIALGELQGRRVRNLEALRIALDASHERERVITDAFQRTQALKETLEERVAGQLQTVFTTYQAAKAIEKTGTGAVLLGIADLVRSVLAPRKFSLFLLNRDVLEASTSEGWTSEDLYARYYDAQTTLFRTVVGERRVLCAASPDDRAVLGEDGLLAGPLVSVDTGAVVGMLKVEEIGFVGLTLNTVLNFRLLCDWIGTAYANAHQFEQVTESMQQAVSFPRSSFDSHTRFLRELSRRAGFPVAIIRLRVDPGRSVIAPEVLHHDVREVVGTALRGHDLLFERHNESNEFDLALPMVSPEEATHVIERLVAGLKKKFGTGIDVTWTVQSLEKMYVESVIDSLSTKPRSRVAATRQTQLLDTARDDGTG